MQGNHEQTCPFLQIIFENKAGGKIIEHVGGVFIGMLIIVALGYVLGFVLGALIRWAIIGWITLDWNFDNHNKQLDPSLSFILDIITTIVQWFVTLLFLYIACLIGGISAVLGATIKEVIIGMIKDFIINFLMDLLAHAMVTIIANVIKFASEASLPKTINNAQPD